MLAFSQKNKKKIERCTLEAITTDMKEQYTDMGDASPLYKYIFCIRIRSLPIDTTYRYTI